MNSNDIRSLMNFAFEHEEQTQTVAMLFADTLAATGVPLTLAQQTEYLEFVKGYVRETPDIMDAAYHAAQQDRALDAMQPIFDAAFSYWSEQHDFIPDNHGLIGLADDAYLTRMFMESVSDLHSANTGHPLLSIDLAPANRMMRSIIGEPIVSQLEALIGQTVASQMIQAGLQNLAGFGSLDLNVSGYSDYISNYEIDQDVNIGLGAMGIG